MEPTNDQPAESVPGRKVQPPTRPDGDLELVPQGPPDGPPLMAARNRRASSVVKGWISYLLALGSSTIVAAFRDRGPHLIAWLSAGREPDTNPP